MAAAGPTEAVVGLLAAAAETGRAVAIILVVATILAAATTLAAIILVAAITLVVAITLAAGTTLVAGISPVRETSRPAKALAVLQSAIWSRIPERFSMKRTFPIK